jgi:hypothetical protein
MDGKQGILNACRRPDLANINGKKKRQLHLTSSHDDKTDEYRALSSDILSRIISRG